MTAPLSRVWKLKMFAGPVGTLLGADDVSRNRADDRDHDIWPQLLNYPGETNLALAASQPALFPVHVIDRSAAQIDQIATQFAK